MNNYVNAMHVDCFGQYDYKNTMLIVDQVPGDR